MATKSGLRSLRSVAADYKSDDNEGDSARAPHCGTYGGEDAECEVHKEVDAVERVEKLDFGRFAVLNREHEESFGQYEALLAYRVEDERCKRDERRLVGGERGVHLVRLAAVCVQVISAKTT